MQNSSSNLTVTVATALIVAAIWCVIAVAKANQPDKYYDGNLVKVTIGDASVLSIECKDYPGELEHCAFIRVHEDEDAALTAGQAFVEKHGGRLIVLRYGGGRRIQYTMRGMKCIFDANRMYSLSGLADAMIAVPSSATSWEIACAERGVYDESALNEAMKYSEQVLDLLDGFDRIIALHNDMNGGWNVRAYLDEPAEASQVFVSKDMDTDDFFIVTHEADFNAIKDLGLNAVLQNNALVPDDGSLSVYYRFSDVRYINCEAEDGEVERQTAMLEAIYPLLAKCEGEEKGKGDSEVEVP